MCEFDVKSVRLSYDLKVRTPMGDQTNTVYKNCEIRIEERKLLGDLISLAIKR